MRVILTIIFLYLISACQLSNSGVQKSRDAAADTLPKEATVENLSTKEELGSWKLTNIRNLSQGVVAVNTVLHENGAGKVDILMKDSLKIYIDVEWSLKNDTMESTASNFVVYQLQKDRQTGETKEELVEERGGYTEESKAVVLELTNRKIKVQDIETATIYEYTR